MANVDGVAYFGSSDGHRPGGTTKQGRPPILKEVAYHINSRDTDEDTARNHSNYKSRRGGVHYELLRKAAAQPLIASIIKTRLNQVLDFTHPQEDKYSNGFKVVLADRRRDARSVNRRERAQMRWIEDFVAGCGRDRSYYRDDFADFTKKVMHDSLAFDQVNHQNVWARDGMPHSFVAVDAATVRRVMTARDRTIREGRHAPIGPLVKGHEPAFVQVYLDEPIAAFYPWEMAFGVRNPRTDIGSNGYGTSEIEEMISLITALMWSFQYNANFFRNGSHPKGIFRVSKDFSRSSLKEFREHFRTRLQGVDNAHRQGFVEAEKLDWIDLQKTNRDMEFSEWNAHLVKTACSVFQIDPAEVNFPVDSHQAPNQFERAGEQKLKASRDKGLKPLLRFYQKYINRHVVSSFFDGKYKLVFAGIDSHTRDEELQYMKDMTQFLQSPNEVREELGLKRIDHPIADRILNNAYLNAVQQYDQMAAQASEAEGEGEVSDVSAAPTPEHKSIVSKLLGGDGEAIARYEEKYDPDR